MISYEEALSIVSSIPVNTTVEEIPFDQCVNRILAEDLAAQMNMPPFDKSAVDGFACRSNDIGLELEIVETVPAGKMPEKSVVEGTCIRIMTGAPVPAGANMILMVEDCEVSGNKLQYKSDSKNRNICFVGEDIRSGEMMIKAGTLLRPQHIAVMAALGYTQAKVFEKTLAAVLSTGNELVEPDVIPQPSQIRNSNSWQLVAQIEQAGGEPTYFGIVPDDFDKTVEYLQRAISENDIVFLSGGVSAGEFDFVPKAMQQLGFDIVFDSIAVQPGRPTTLAVKGNKFIFGLPGNPVSSFVQFHLLGRILLLRMAGWKAETKILKGVAGTTISRKKAARKSFYPVTTDANGFIVPIEYHGSAHINSLLNAIGVIPMEVGVNTIEEGSLVDVRLF